MKEFINLQLVNEDGIDKAIVTWQESEGGTVKHTYHRGYNNPPINKDTPKQEQLAWAVKQIKQEA
jgi:hypothetical protein